MSDLLRRLRHETRERHEAMEAVFRLPSTREEHRRWTERFWGFVKPFERLVTARLGGADPLLHGRLKADWLRADLQVLGLQDEEIERLPECEALPPLETDAQVAGACYVMEGSTLGGQLIARHLEDALGLSGGQGYRYFRSYGAEVPGRWQEFRRTLEQRVAPASTDEAVAAANETFSSLHAWFARSV